MYKCGKQRSPFVISNCLFVLLQEEDNRDDDGNDDWGTAPQLVKPDDQLELSEAVCFNVYTIIIIIEKDNHSIKDTFITSNVPYPTLY